MSPVFRHGRLRLYLLKLLDEAPRHGYEVIRLLQDRFMGVYAPSPGTIYPRLARLEEEGLVTHDEVDGRKVYRITDKGREEIHGRLDELEDLERELTESVRDIAREVKEDVRETVRSLREELTWAARDVHREERRQSREDASQEAHRVRDEAHDDPERERDDGHEQAEGAREETQTRRARDDPRWKGADPRERARPERDAPPGARRGPHEARAHFRSEREQSKRGWADWPGWRDWSGWTDWTDWTGRRGWPGQPEPTAFRDLERLARDFAAELGRLASHASAVGEDAVGDLRGILDEALTRIRDEIFKSEATRRERHGGAKEPDPDEGEN